MAAQLLVVLALHCVAYPALAWRLRRTDASANGSLQILDPAGPILNLQDGYLSVTCSTPPEENHVLARYSKVVPKEDRVSMTHEVCFEFCRTVPDALYFGIANGHDCFCAPWLQADSDSAECVVMCEGNHVQMCGGESASSMFSMHACHDAALKFSEASHELGDSESFMQIALGALVDAARSMQGQAEVLQETLGRLGDPAASALMQIAKISAGKLEKAAVDSHRILSELHEQAAIGLDWSNSTWSVKGAILTAQFPGVSIPARLFTAAGAINSHLTKDDTIKMERYTSLFAELTEKVRASTAELEALVNKASPLKLQITDGPEQKYYPLMYFVDKAFVEVPVTCAGDLAREPIVGKTYSECAAACDADFQTCVGFSYYPSKLCFLFSKFTSLTYYTGCTVTMDAATTCSARFSKFEGTSLKPDPAGKCKGCLKSATKADRCPSYVYRGVRYTGRNLEIFADAFSTGTFIIKEPGLYMLAEDVVFNPQTPLTSGNGADSSFPDPFSREYPQLGGYFLGFFAAVAIEADGVVFDCQNHSIGMSREFLKRQRFFSIFELASKPFISGVGPPQFANGLLSSFPVRPANNVTIRNCHIGLSSHHGVHGNENTGVTLQNLKIKDFEVGGVHLNGASDVVIENVDIGPSLRNTFAAQLSHAIFLDHLMNTLIPTNAVMAELAKDLPITLRGTPVTIGTVFSKLHADLQEFLASGGGPLASLFGSGDSLPDGSSIYGIVLHKSGPAVNDFGACPLFGAQEESEKLEHNVKIANVHIHDLALKADQWTRWVVDGNQVMGPAGDVFRFWQVTDQKTYVGNSLSDAQLAVGAFKKAAKKAGVNSERLSWFFGGVHVPDSVLTWAAGTGAWNGQSKFECFGDAMSHVNKGAVGLRLAYQNQVVLSGVVVSDIENSGVLTDPNICQDSKYKGRDVRGVAIVNSFNVNKSGLTVDGGSLRSLGFGASIPIDAITTF